MNLTEGSIVIHPKRTEWGPGKVLQVDGSKLTVYFRDVAAETPEEAVRKIDTIIAPLDLAAQQHDKLLDNLPPFRDGRFERPVRPRVTFQEGLQAFHLHFPQYFDDPAYLGDERGGERHYKVAAHNLFQETLGAGQLRSILMAGRIEEVTRRLLAVEGRVNLLAVFEKAALRSAFRNGGAAEEFATALDTLLDAGPADREVLERYLSVVEQLPAEAGKTDPAKWTVATIFPYLAAPDRFMFLKPMVTQSCAARLTFNLKYSTELTFVTYNQLMKMSTYLLDELRPYGARDFIDVQSFIWLIGAGFD